MAEYVNNTGFTPEEIGACPLIGETVNKWRQLVIRLHEHPTDPDRVISIGYAFAGGLTVVCDEPRTSWSTALDYIAQFERIEAAIRQQNDLDRKETAHGRDTQHPP